MCFSCYAMRSLFVPNHCCCCTLLHPAFITSFLVNAFYSDKLLIITLDIFLLRKYYICYRNCVKLCVVVDSIEFTTSKCNNFRVFMFLCMVCVIRSCFSNFPSQFHIYSLPFSFTSIYSMFFLYSLSLWMNLKAYANENQVDVYMWIWTRFFVAECAIAWIMAFENCLNMYNV